MSTLRCRSWRRLEENSQKIQDQDLFPHTLYPSTTVDQGQGYGTSKQEIWSGIQYPLQLWFGVHWRRPWGQESVSTRQLSEEEDRKSAVADHTWTNQHHLKWENTTIIDGSRNKHVLQIKEALRRGHTRQLCCYNSATKLQATNHTVCHRRYLLHATTFVARNMLPRIDQLSISRNFVAMKHQRRAACCTQQ